MITRLGNWLRKLLARKPEEKPYRILVDREGVAYLPVTPVKLKAKK